MFDRCLNFYIPLTQDQWQADIDKLYSEYEACKSDKVEYEEMVDRLSLEMEDRIEGLKMEHNETIAIKDNHIRDLYSKVRNDNICPIYVTIYHQ